MLWLAFVLVVLILAGDIGYHVYQEHRSIEADERQQLANQSKIVDENLSLRLITLNSALDSIRTDLPWLLRQKNGQALANGQLHTMVNAMVGVRTFVFMNIDGIAIASNRKELVGQDFRDGDRFRAIRQGGDPATFYVSAPFKTPLGAYAMSVGKVVPNDKGKFGGVILAILDPEFFRTLLNSVRYTQDTRSSVVHGDGMVVFSTQDKPDIAGIDLHASADSFFNQHLRSGRSASLFSGTAASTGDDRLLAIRTIRPEVIAMNKPLVVTVSRAIPAIYAQWQQQAIIKIGLFAGLVLAGVLGMFFYQQRRLAYVRLLADRDVERKRSEATLQASEEQFRTLFSTMSEGFCLHEIICDETGTPCDVRHLMANPAYERHTGRKAADFIGRTVREMYPDVEPIWIQRYGKVALTGEPAHFQAEFGPLGRWFEVSAYQTQPGRFAVVLTDITEQKLSEERLRQQAMVFNITEEGIVITDAQGRVIDANPAFERITEYSLESIRGQNMRFVQSGRHDRAFYRNMWNILSEKGNWQGEIWNRRKSGDIFLEWISISAVHDDKGNIVNYVGTSIDINRMKHVQSELERLAHHDWLTSLPNRQLLSARLEHAIDRTKRYGGMGAVLFIDLDRFKQVNDTLGHKAGDELLQAVASRVEGRLRNSDTLARLGGDEFVIVLEDISEPEAAATVAQDVIDNLCSPFPLSCGTVANIGASIGIAIFPKDGSRATPLIDRADQALYEAKSGGRGVYRFFAVPADTPAQ